MFEPKDKTIVSKALAFLKSNLDDEVEDSLDGITEADIERLQKQLESSSAEYVLASEGGDGVKAKVTFEGGQLSVALDGHGDACSQDGYGEQVLVEFRDGKAQVLAWADINQEDPTHNISLDGAKLEHRNTELEP